MKRLSEILATLNDAEKRAGLTDSQLRALEREALALFDSITEGAVPDVPADDLDKLNEVASAVDLVREEAAKRLDAAAKASETEAERAAKVSEIRDRLHPPVVAETPETPEAPEVPETPDPAEAVPTTTDAPVVPEEQSPTTIPGQPGVAPGEGVPASIESETPVPVGAASTTPAVPPTGAITPPAAMAPVHTQSRAEGALIRSLVTGGDMNERALAELIIQRREDMGYTPEGFQENIRLGRMSLAYPEDRMLSSRDVLGSEQKIDAVCADAHNPSNWRDEAIVASGGFCAPPQVDYSIPTISEGQRPVRDSLPRFGVDRGALTFTRPPSMSAVLTGGPTSSESGLTTAAIGTWTAAIDTTPGSNVKGCQTIPCGTPVTVTLDALYRCLQFGNLTSRAYPELVQAWLRNTEAAWARYAETYLLDKIGANSTAVTTTKLLGSYRDLLGNILQAAAAYRNRNRMQRTARLRIMLPGWVVEMASADRVREQASSREILTVTEATLRMELNNVGLNVTFYEDTETGAGQVIGAQGPTDLRNWPSTVRWYLFHEGAFVMLDGGELDFGLVRDSVLNKTNDYRLFYETFEQVAFRGFESMKVTSTVCPDGTSALPLTTAGLCTAS